MLTKRFGQGDAMLDDKQKSSYIVGMNKLHTHKRAQILSMLCEGSSMRSISRVCDVSINTVAKILADAGRVCMAFHDEKVRGIASKRVQVDEIWSFCAAKQKNVPTMTKPVEGAGDVWTWTAIDADNKLPARRVRVHFITETSGIFDEIDFESAGHAEAALTRNGFRRFDTSPDLQSFLRAPGTPFHRTTHPNGPIYSSGRYWRN